MQPQRVVTSYGLASIPVIVIGLLHVSISPLASMFKANQALMYSTYSIGIVLGFLMMRRARIQRDHEWQRSRAMSQLDSHFKAEDQGVWEAPDAHVDTNLSPDAINTLGGKVESLNKETKEEELDPDNKVEVDLLMESNHVLKATRRVTGEESFDEEEVKSTVGARRKSSPMDRIIDFFSRLFNKESDPEDQRHQKNMETLQTRAAEDPVVISPPNVGVSEPETEISVTETENIVVTTPEPRPESLETMAMFEQVHSTDSGMVAQSGIPCSTCGFRNETDERFCAGCGMNL